MNKLQPDSLPNGHFEGAYTPLENKTIRSARGDAEVILRVEEFEDVLVQPMGPVVLLMGLAVFAQGRIVALCKLLQRLAGRAAPFP